jgi:hypothetical protein
MPPTGAGCGPRTHRPCPPRTPRRREAGIPAVKVLGFQTYHADRRTGRPVRGGPGATRCACRWPSAFRRRRWPIPSRGSLGGWRWHRWRPQAARSSTHHRRRTSGHALRWVLAYRAANPPGAVPPPPTAGDRRRPPRAGRAAPARRPGRMVPARAAGRWRAALLDRADLRVVFLRLFPEGIEFRPVRVGKRQIWRLEGAAAFGRVALSEAEA